MKQILPFICLFSSINLHAQHSEQEIKKFKIIKIIKESISSDADISEKHENLYDRNGKETASYIDGQQITKSENQYNRAGKLVKVIIYDMLANNSIISNSVYTYKTDGSYSVKTTIISFGTVINKWYDKVGRLTRRVVPGENEDLYKYNSAGKLISVKTKQGTSDGDITDLKYSYNTKGQRSKEVSEGTYRWTRNYSYDAKGILAKVITVGTDEGVETTTTDTYTYEFWK